MSPAKQEHFDLVIAGAGITGATLACLLAPAQLRIALVDAGEPPRVDLSGYDPRVVALSAASEEIFRRIGVWESVVGTRACAYREMFVWDGDGTGNIHFDCRDTGASHLGHIVENSILGACLADTLRSQAQLHIMSGCRVSALQREGAAMSVGLDDGPTLSADLVVAADGGRSRLRELAGFALREWDYGHTAIVTTVRTAQPHRHTAWQRFAAEGPLALLPLAGDANDYSSIVWSVDHAYAEQLLALDDPQFCHTLSRVSERRLGEILHVDPRHSFPLRQLHARRYSQPQVVLVGDAAHTIHPLAGQGANLGIYDVDVLAAEITRARARGLPLSDDSITRRYERRRQWHNLSTMAAMDGFKSLFGSEDPALRWLRNEGLRVADALPWLKRQFSRAAGGHL